MPAIIPRIRAAEREDASVVAELLGQLGYPTDAVVVRRRLDTLLSRADSAVVVAEVWGDVVGLGALQLFPVLHEDVPLGQLTALVVAEPCRGRGIGQALVRHLEETARAVGAHRIVVTTANHRAPTHRFYERLGYRWTGRRYARSLDGAE